MTSVLMAMSGGVDSSVAAAILAEQGHEVVGVTMKLWGGASDTGCCSVADVDDARRVAQQLGIAHYVFNFGDEFEAGVVKPYVAAHAAGRTPNPCIECNRRLKFDRLMDRADELGIEAVATGHHARVVHHDGAWRLRRGADPAKDQSYVLHMLGQSQLVRTLLPVGDLTKAEVRDRAVELGLRTAAKPDSQDVCFITSSRGRAGFLHERMSMRPGRVVSVAGDEVGRVEAVEMVTVGQRRGLGLTGGGPVQYALDVDVATATVTIGSKADLDVDRVAVADASWVTAEPDGAVEVQSSAHGRPRLAHYDRATAVVHYEEPTTRVAPGQSVVLYLGDDVLGGGTAA